MHSFTPKSNNIIFGISGKAGSGKDAVASIICKLCFRANIECERVAYADAVKNIARELFGYSQEEVFVTKPPKVRDHLQKIGTAIRKYDVDFWVTCLNHTISEKSKLLWPEELKVFVVPDVRFPNEVKALQEQSALIIRRDNSSSSPQSALLAEAKEHPSETALDGHEFKYIIPYCNSLASLEARVVELINLAPEAHQLATILGNRPIL